MGPYGVPESEVSVLDRDFDFEGADFYLYGRQSDKKSFGNASTRMQTEDLLADVVRFFKIDPQSHPYLRQFHEVRSAVDGRVRYQYSTDGSARISGLRPELVTILNEARNRVRYTEDPRPQIICVSILNRLGRSEQTVAQLHEAAVAAKGKLYVWSVKDGGRLLNPLDPGDMMQLTFAILFAGKRESEDKAKFVRAAKENIIRSNGRRVLGKIPLGYETFLAKDNGADPPEPVTSEWKGEVVSLIRVNEKEAEIVRDIFHKFRSGWHMAKIVQYLNRTYPEGNPKGTPWSGTDKPRWGRGSLRNLLRNPIYIGRRVYNRTNQVGVATDHYRSTEKSEWINAPYEESLRILDDELFHAVQGMLAGSTFKRGPGRPMTTEYLFHRIGKLRCGVCGGLMSLVRYRRKQAFAYYYCCSRDSLSVGQHTCQRVLASDVDSTVKQALRHHFSELKSYALQLKEDIKQSSSAVKRREVETKLRALQDVYDQNQRDFLNPEFRSTLPERLREQFLIKMDEQLDEIERLSARLARWGETEDIKHKQRQLATISGVLAFDRTSAVAQRGVLAEMCDAVYLWPHTLEPMNMPTTSARLSEDAVIWLQWKGEDKDRSPLPIGFADDWPVLDYEALDRTVDVLIEKAELTIRGVAGGLSTESPPLSMGYHTVANRKIPISTIRAYANARALYVDMEALKQVVRERMTLAVGQLGTQSKVLETYGITVRTLRKILGVNKRPLSRPTWLKVAQALSIDLEPFRKLPDGIYHPEGLEQVVYWSTGVAFPEYLQWVATLPDKFTKGLSAGRWTNFDQAIVYANRPNLPT